MIAASCAQKPASRHASDTLFSAQFFSPYQQAAQSAFALLCDTRAKMIADCDVCALTFRLKSPASIRGKLIKKGLPVTAAAAHAALHDIAGLRVVLSSTEAVYRFAALLRQSPTAQLLSEHDYIASPKESGYRSLHLIMRVPALVHGMMDMVPVEIQLRTAGMDAWANIEHELIYKPQ